MNPTIMAPAWRTSEWLNTEAPLEIEALRGQVVVACAFQVLCPGCVSHTIPQTMAAYHMQGTPTLMLIDRAGRLRRQVFGHMPDLRLGAEIMRLMAES